MKSKKIKEVLLFALFVFPAVAFVLFATDIPFVMNLYYSVFEWNGIGKSMKFVGLDNFVKIFTNDSLFWKGVTFILCGDRECHFSCGGYGHVKRKKIIQRGKSILLYPLYYQSDGNQFDLEIYLWTGI